jgi:hypothetical protein
MFTLFSCPKPFHNHIGVIQRNAIHSWTLLRPNCEIILLGDEEGTAEIAAEFDLRHEPKVARNEFGTPLVNDLFAKAEHLAAHDILCYVSTDMILMQYFMRAVQQVASRKSRFLMVGRRWNVDLREPWDFSAPDWEAKLRVHAREHGELFSEWGIDYFVFPRGLFGNLLPFALGRSFWDNWLLYRARRKWTAVVDATHDVMVVHQNHDHGQFGRNKEAVWESPEGQYNRELASGCLFSLEEATHMLGQNRLRYNWSTDRILRHLFSFFPAGWRLDEKIYRLRRLPRLLYFRFAELSYPIRAPLGLSRSARKRKEPS